MKKKNAEKRTFLDVSSMLLGKILWLLALEDDLCTQQWRVFFPHNAEEGPTDKNGNVSFYSQESCRSSYFLEQ